MEIKSYTYSCVMALAPERLAQKVKRFAMSIPDHYIFMDRDGEHGREKEPHVTVKYGLLSGNPDVVKKKITSRPFMIYLGDITTFVNDDFVVLKIDIISDELRELNKQVSRIPNEDSYPVYHPHMTIAYLNRNSLSSYDKYYGDFFSGESWLCDSLVMTTPNEERYNISLVESLSKKVETDFMIKLREKGL